MMRRKYFIVQMLGHELLSFLSRGAQCAEAHCKQGHRSPPKEALGGAVSFVVKTLQCSLPSETKWRIPGVFLQGRDFFLAVHPAKHEGASSFWEVGLSSLLSRNPGRKLGFFKSFWIFSNTYGDGRPFPRLCQ